MWQGLGRCGAAGRMVRWPSSTRAPLSIVPVSVVRIPGRMSYEHVKRRGWCDARRRCEAGWPSDCRTKSATASAAANGSCLSFRASVSGPVNAPLRSDKGGSRVVYGRKTLREHIRSRPETYVGSVQPRTERTWVAAPTSSPWMHPPNGDLNAVKHNSTSMRALARGRTKAQKVLKADYEALNKIGPRKGGVKGKETGTASQQNANGWVFPSFVRKPVTFTPAFVKVVDEIVVNALDNAQRDQDGTSVLHVWVEAAVPKESSGKTRRRKSRIVKDIPVCGLVANEDDVQTRDGVGMDAGDVIISVYNNGKGIPVVLEDHCEGGMKGKKRKEGETSYLPEIMFGELLTGSNFDEDDRKASRSRRVASASRVEGVGGRNGYGAKLTNLFSRYYRVDTYDSEHKVFLSQCWADGMARKSGQRPVVYVDEDVHTVPRVRQAAAHGLPPSEALRIVGVGTERLEAGGIGGEEDVVKGWRKHRNAVAAKVKKASLVADGGVGGDPLSDFTRVTFIPDLDALGLKKNISDDQDIHIQGQIMDLIWRRVYDAAASSAGQLNVFMNGIGPISYGRDKSEALGAYARAHEGLDSQSVASFSIGDRMQVAVGLRDKKVNGSAGGTGAGAGVVSFVNGLVTSRGGTHVNALMQDLCKDISDMLSKPSASSVASSNGKEKDGERKALVAQIQASGSLNPRLVRSQLAVFVNCMINHPEFESQAKQSLETRVEDYGFRMKVPASAAQAMIQSTDLVPRLAAHAQARDLAALVRAVKQSGARTYVSGDGDSVQSGGSADGTSQPSIRAGSRKGAIRVSGIDKLEDANAAGSSLSERCTLVVTEGDSAKALAMAGLSVVGRDYYGVYPLRGKVLNVRAASQQQLVNNVELTELMSVLGLVPGRKYDAGSAARQGLRYGRVMLMTDQDVDGSHIKGLVASAFEHFWPSLVYGKSDTTPDVPPFLWQFVTPLVKARKSRSNDVHAFYSAQDFEDWYVQVPEYERRKWSIKYYKGLGTSTSQEAREYFQNIDNHLQPLSFEDAGASQRALHLAFAKERDSAEKRKHWLLTAPALHSADHAGGAAVELSREDVVPISDFVHKELVHFSHADNVRSIPSVMDGLKPGQRKVVHSCLQRPLTSELKVAQLAGYVGEHTAYHHGEASLFATIVNLAQDYVGCFNNVPILEPVGQFGTRHALGKDAASPRYIFTRLHPRLSSTIYRNADAGVLPVRVEEGQTIEPQYTLPVVPLSIMNGTSGMGTGWSTFIPPHSVEGTVNVMHEWLSGVEKELGDTPEAILRRLSSDGDEIFVRLGPAVGAENQRKRAQLRPWFRGYAGDIIEPQGEGSRSWVVYGRAARVAQDMMVITELPIGVSTAQFRARLAASRDGNTTAGSKRVRGPLDAVADFTEHHTDKKVLFYVAMPSEVLDDVCGSTFEEKDGRIVQPIPRSGLEQLKLKSTLPVSNMHMFDGQNSIRKYDNAMCALEEFMPLRLRAYGARLERHVHDLTIKERRVGQRLRFVEAVANGELDIRRQRKDALVARLFKDNFEPYSQPNDTWEPYPLNDVKFSGYPAPPSWIDGRVGAVSDGARVTNAHGMTFMSRGSDVGAMDGLRESLGPVHVAKDSLPRSMPSSDEKRMEPKQGNYDYLLSQPLWSLTSERVDDLRREAQLLREKRAKAAKLTPFDVWREELNEFSDSYASYEADERISLNQDLSSRLETTMQASSDSAVNAQVVRELMELNS